MGDNSMSLKTIRAASLGMGLLAATLLTGCVGDLLGGPRGPYDSTYNQTQVRGTVVRVDTQDRFLVVDREGAGYDDNLRNSDDPRYDPNDRYGDQVTVYFDDRTAVEHQGSSYRPEDLERGDRIEARVESSSTGRLVAEQIQVLYDATADSNSNGGYDEGLGYRDLRGTVRYVDTRARSLEIEPSRYDNRFSTGSSPSNVVRVFYDSSTDVSFQGRRYGPENLERGDEVEVAYRDTGGRLLAQRIVVVGESRPLTR